MSETTPNPVAWGNGARMARKGDVAGKVQVAFKPGAYYDTPLYSAERVHALETIIHEMATEIECYVNAEHPAKDAERYPSVAGRRERDLEIVERARALIGLQPVAKT